MTDKRCGTCKNWKADKVSPYNLAMRTCQVHPATIRFNNWVKTTLEEKRNWWDRMFNHISPYHNMPMSNGDERTNEGQGTACPSWSEK